MPPAVNGSTQRSPVARPPARPPSAASWPATPPTANQFNTSRDFEDLIDKGMLADLEKHASAGHWRDAMPEALVDVSVRNGKFYALPVNIHGRNWIWFNQAVLDEAGAKAPTGWGDDMFEALDKVKAAGKIPLAISGRPVYEMMLFHSVVLGVGGRDLWMDSYAKHDKAVLTGATMRKAFETFGRLRAYVDEGTPGRAWNVATNLVITGKAAFTSVGDWAKGEFSAAGMTAGREYGCIIPGGVVSIGGDVFVFPKQNDPEKLKAQDLLVEVMSKPETLKAFNKLKGSVPSRTDVDMSGTDACAQSAMTALKKKESRVPRMSMLVRADVAGEIRDLLSEFWNDPSMTVDDAMERHAEILLDS